MTTRTWWLAVALVACSKHDDDYSRLGKPEVLAPPPIPHSPPTPKAAEQGPAAGDEVTEMFTRGYLSIDDAKGKREELVPESPRGHGEFPEGCYAAADGAVYAVGKQYTGVDGPDDGVVWKRAADGTWSMPLRLELRQLSSIAGIAPDDIVAGGARGYWWWNGKTWTQHDTPQDWVKVWSDGKTIYGSDFDAKTWFKIVHGELQPAPKSAHDWRDDKYVCARGAAHYRVGDHDKPIGKRKLSPAEAAEIRGEVKQIEEHPENIRPVKP